MLASSSSGVQHCSTVLLASAALLLLLPPPPLAAATTGDANQPHILMVLIDDWGWANAGCEWFSVLLF
jgi:hypothetical protein